MNQSSIPVNQPKTREIPFDQWIPFLAEFTRENRGAHARLEVVGPKDEPLYQVETENRPLDGVSADIKDCERTVWISFGSRPGQTLTHGVHSATAIRVLSETEDTGPTFEVEASDGTKTILELTKPEEYALPPTESQ
jgi:hypothetical protein